jgi:hypothetical protein
MKKVSVIISNKNTGALLKAGLQNLEKIKKTYYEDLEVIVVDSGSDDGSVDMIKKEYPWVQVSESEDKGLSAASNLGTKKATGDYFLFLGPDAYPRHRTIKGMVDYMEKNPDVGLSTPKLYLQKGALDHDAHRSFPTPWNSFTRLTGLYKLFPKSRFFNAYFMWYEDLDSQHEIDACVYGFMLVRRKVFEEVDGFDADYYAHGEDLDLCYKIKEKGYKVMYLPQWESGHFKTRIPGTKDRLKKKTEEPLSTKIAFARSSTDAMRVFMRKHYKKKYIAPLIWFMSFGTYLLELQRILVTVLKHIFS